MNLPRTTAAIRTTVAAVAAGVVYAVLWVAYCQHWHWLSDADWALLNSAHDIGVKHPAWVQFWALVSTALGPVPLRIVGAVSMAVALVKRKMRAALLLLTGVVLNGFVTLVAKSLVNRPRPATALVAAPSTSFPSGHALEVTASLLALLAVALPMTRRPPVRRTAVALTALWAVAVGIARVALNVHYPSDVLAGWALGYLYFLLCWLIFRPSNVIRSRCSD